MTFDVTCSATYFANLPRGRLTTAQTNPIKVAKTSLMKRHSSSTWKIGDVGVDFGLPNRQRPREVSRRPDRCPSFTWKMDSRHDSPFRDENSLPQTSSSTWKMRDVAPLLACQPLSPMLRRSTNRSLSHLPRGRCSAAAPNRPRISSMIRSLKSLLHDFQSIDFLLCEAKRRRRVSSLAPHGPTAYREDRMPTPSSNDCPLRYRTFNEKSHCYLISPILSIYVGHATVRVRWTACCAPAESRGRCLPQDAGFGYINFLKPATHPQLAGPQVTVVRRASAIR